MKRGDIWLVDLDPAEGSEANKTRPAIIVSNDFANRASSARRRGVITVVPVTSNVGRVYTFQVFLPAGGGLSVDSKAQVEQIRAVDVSRFVRQLGAVDSDRMIEIDAALVLHLEL